MNAVIQTGLPIVILFAMIVVGMELALDDLRRVMQAPIKIATVLLAQALGLPLLAVAIASAIPMDPAIAGGLLLVACAPQATMSNYFCLMARSDISLSVTLTAVSSILALVMTPLIASTAFHFLFDQHQGLKLPVMEVMQQLATGMFVPLAAGMAVRHLAPDFVKRHRRRLQGLSMGGLGAMLILVSMAEGSTILHLLLPTSLVAVLFTSAAATFGFSLARSLSWPRADVITLVAAFPARSLSVATLIAVNNLGRLEFLPFAFVFFVIQAVLLIPIMLVSRMHVQP